MLIAALLATLATGLFTGAAVYITFVEHPARVSCGSALAVTEFGPSYKRASVMQASLALMGASAGIARWGTGGGPGWLVSGKVLGAVVPFTLIVILPTNHRLLDASLDKASSEEAARLGLPAADGPHPAPHRDRAPVASRLVGRVRGPEPPPC